MKSPRQVAYTEIDDLRLRHRWVSKLAVAAGRLYCLGDPNVRARLRAFHAVRILAREQVHDVLDAGCGRTGKLGWFGGIAPIAHALSRILRETQIVGYDFDQGIVQHNRGCAKRSGANNLEFRRFDLRAEPPIHLFDGVVFSDIARDAVRDGPFIEAVARHVRPGGVLVLIVPSKFQLTLNSSFRRRLVETGFDFNDLADVMFKSGLSVQRMGYITGSPAGAVALLMGRISEISFPLMMFVFPFLMAASIGELLRYPAAGDAIIAIGRRDTGAA